MSLAFPSHLRICSAALPNAFAALGAVGIEEMPIENESAFGSCNEDRVESWPAKENFDSESIELVDDLLPRLKYDSSLLGDNAV